MCNYLSANHDDLVKTSQVHSEVVGNH